MLLKNIVQTNNGNIEIYVNLRKRHRNNNFFYSLLDMTFTSKSSTNATLQLAIPNHWEGIIKNEWNNTYHTEDIPIAEIGTRNSCLNLDSRSSIYDQNCSLTKIVLPNTLEVINPTSLSHLMGIKKIGKIVFPYNADYSKKTLKIKDYAFEGICLQNKKIIFPEYKQINFQKFAFANLNEIYIPQKTKLHCVKSNADALTKCKSSDHALIVRC